jgi:pilus assembly protein CpaB
LKRSNRLVLLIGVLLAVLAFGGVIYLFNNQPKPTSTAPTQLPTVYAKNDIPLGTVITSDMVEARNQDVTVRDPNAYGDVGQVVGKTARAEIKKDQIILPTDFSAGAGGGSQNVASLLDPGMRAIAVQVDQSTGVGTLINVGDRVDLVLGITGADKFPLVTRDTVTNSLTGVVGYNPTSTKVVLQSMQVIGTLVPPPPTTSSSSSSSGSSSGSTGSSTDNSATSLTGQQELVILAVTDQQAEVIKWAQIDGQISLVLRSPKDFVDATGKPVTPQNETTTGIVLKTLIDQWGVLPPEVIAAQNLPK